jgi:hypothetical protein
MVVQRERVKLPPTKRVGGRRKKDVHTESQVKANELLGHLDAADFAIKRAGFYNMRWGLAGDEERPGVLEQIRQFTRQAWTEQQQARVLWEAIRTPPGVPGTPFDPGIEGVVKEYRTWTTTSGREVEELDRKAALRGDTWDEIGNLRNGMPELLRELVAARHLTVRNPMGTSYGPQGAGKGRNLAYYFKETNAWTVHVHRQSHGGGSVGLGQITAHYKPTSDEGGVGYNVPNRVDPATLRMLNIDVYTT